MTRPIPARRTVGAAPLALALAVVGAAAHADEGMWTFDDFPSALTQQRYDFTPTPEWLAKVRRASARLARGCSASFVSPDGLVLTNHHCVHDCVEKLSTAKDDFVARGFLARAGADERPCPGMELNQLVDITDVTREVQAATQGLADAKFVEARNGKVAELERACAPTPDLRCDVVTLYAGGRYALYKYRRFRDVRLAFAPEVGIAHFGGDPDNFNFPRYALDMALLRVFVDGKPAATPDFLPFRREGAAEGELVFTSGHPGSTRRLLTVAELRALRDVDVPRALVRIAEFRGLLTAFSDRGKEQARIAKTDLYRYDNAFKAYVGRQQALADPALFAEKTKAEADLRAAIDGDPARKAKYGEAFAEIDRALARQQELGLEVGAKEQPRGFSSTSMAHAITLVRAAEERAKPNAERLPEFTDARLPGIEAALLAAAPIYPELELAKLTFGLTKVREDLGADDPFVRLLLDKKSPRALAEQLVRETKLRDVTARKKLWEGGAEAVVASKDVMIVLARAIDAESRKARRRYEQEVDGPLRRAGEKLGRARLEVLGTKGAPDATFSLRLSFGQVKGFEERGQPVAPFTTFGGLFDRASPYEPFALPASWSRARSKLDPATRFDLCTTNDVIGGNSGSPMVDAQARLVGLVFDGNIHSLGGDYAYVGAKNRTVAVHPAAMLAALEQVYDARRLLEELTRSATK